MGKIKILNREIEFEKIKINVNSIVIDDVTYEDLSDNTWSSIECDGIDILSDRQKAIDETEKSKDIPDKVLALQEGDTDLQLATCELYEQNIVLEEKTIQQETTITDLQLAICELYEGMIS